MTDDTVTVNLDRLDGLIRELTTFSGEVDATLEGLQGRIENLHNQWRGTAAAAHAKAHSEWVQGAQMMSDGAQHLRAASANAHSAFTATLQTNRALFS